VDPEEDEDEEEDGEFCVNVPLEAEEEEEACANTFPDNRPPAANTTIASRRSLAGVARSKTIGERWFTIWVRRTATVYGSVHTMRNAASLLPTGGCGLSAY
jgi:hypothetical protein